MILREAQKLILKYGYQKVTMTDIANACNISRTTLYKSYPNKESIIVGLINEALAINMKETEKLFTEELTFSNKLTRFFDIWTIQPAASVIDLDTGRDILTNVSSYAPAAVANHYQVFESMLGDIIKSELVGEEKITHEDLAHILTIASQGLKSSAKDIEYLEKMVNGLVTIVIMAVTNNNRT